MKNLTLKEEEMLIEKYLTDPRKYAGEITKHNDEFDKGNRHVFLLDDSDRDLYDYASKRTADD